MLKKGRDDGAYRQNTCGFTFLPKPAAGVPREMSQLGPEAEGLLMALDLREQAFRSVKELVAT
jgi:hypothetical protein